MIVLNGQPFLEYNLRALYPFAHQIIIVEGACEAASSLATADGHSTDGTLEKIKQFISDNDPQKKVVLVTAEDEGKNNGFWIEKDEMSQSYAKRATGDWLWRVDYDEFYLEKDLKDVLEMVKTDPDITAVSFPYKQFWGGFYYVETGQWFLYDHPCFHRLFRWEKGYCYTQHRPPTVINTQGDNLRDLKWISHKQMQRKDIFLYHYSYVLPVQAEAKVKYFSHVTWTNEFLDNQKWFDERYLKLKDPFHVGEGLNYLTWLEPYKGPHPKSISAMQQDINSGKLKVHMRNHDDIEKLLNNSLYIMKCRYLSFVLWINANIFRRSLSFLKLLLRRMFRIIGIHNPRKSIISLKYKISFLMRRGLKYRKITGYKDISGWLTESESVMLFDIARSLPDDHPVAVEIGTWLGKSTLLLAKGIKGKSNPSLYCIDPFNADGDASNTALYHKIASELPRPLVEQFRNNMKKHHVDDIIKVLQGYSLDFAATFSDKIDFLFIDGNHEYEAVMQDFEAWSRHIKAGGVIAFHDVEFDPYEGPISTEEFVGPGLVIQQKIIHNPDWTDIKRVDNLFVAHKTLVPSETP